MISHETKLKKELFSLNVIKLLRAMGLKIFSPGADYGTVKPDLVAVYPEKSKYYVFEIISEGCLLAPSPRLHEKDAYREYRNYCGKLFAENETDAAIAAAVICDLAEGLEAFGHKIMGPYALNEMTRYGALAVPQERKDSVFSVLGELRLDFRPLDVLDTFTLILISKEDTGRLPETRNFVKFILSNR